MGTSTVTRSQIAGTIKYLVEPYPCCIDGHVLNYLIYVQILLTWAYPPVMQ